MSNPTQLELIGDRERKILLARNEYDNNDLYNSGNPNALSDGDEKGKGETTTIGSKTDIKERGDNQGRNIYTPNNGYGVTNPNAISDGDEKGRGEGPSGEIGTKTDIFGTSTDPGRIALQAKNIYGPTNQYGVTNPNAISDGDEKGRGEGPGGEVGTNTDIFGNSVAPGRIGLQAINPYTPNNEYGLTNANAISDGDEKGRGEGPGGEIGTKTDIYGNGTNPGRLGLQGKNKFGPNYNYPDF